MNWSVVMVGGVTIFMTLWYLWKRTHGYEGPQVALEANNEVAKGIVGGHEAELAIRRAGGSVSSGPRMSVSQAYRASVGGNSS